MLRQVGVGCHGDGDGHRIGQVQVYEASGKRAADIGPEPGLRWLF
jgi:hypothetical protein